MVMVTVMHQWYQWNKPPLCPSPGLVLEDELKPSRSKRLLLRKAKCIQGKITSLSEIQNSFRTFSVSKSFRDHIWWHLLKNIEHVHVRYNCTYNFITITHPPRTIALPWWTCLRKYDPTNIFSKRNLSRVQIPNHRSTRLKSNTKSWGNTFWIMNIYESHLTNKGKLPSARGTFTKTASWNMAGHIFIEAANNLLKRWGIEWYRNNQRE